MKRHLWPLNAYFIIFIHPLFYWQEQGINHVPSPSLVFTSFFLPIPTGFKFLMNILYCYTSQTFLHDFWHVNIFHKLIFICFALNTANFATYLHINEDLANVFAWNYQKSLTKVKTTYINESFFFLFIILIDGLPAPRRQWCRAAGICAFDPF